MLREFAETGGKKGDGSVDHCGDNGDQFTMIDPPSGPFKVMIGPSKVKSHQK